MTDQMRQENHPSLGDNRAEPRHALTIRAAKLISESRDYLCVIRDVSPAGVRLRFFHPMPQGRSLTLQLPCGSEYALSLVWQRGMDSGYSFAEEVDIDAFIRNAGNRPHRPLRFTVDLPASLLVQGEQVPARVTNLSTQGAAVTCSQHIALNQALMLETDYTPIMAARVRWRQDGRYGLVLDDTFGLTELATLIAHHHDAIRRPPIRSLPGVTYEHSGADSSPVNIRDPATWPVTRPSIRKAGPS